MKILATVAARGGSRGLKNKNIKNFLGKPLIAYTIEQVIRWGGFTKFIVSTDSNKIAEIAMRFGAEVPFMRPPKLATNIASKSDVLRHAFIEAQRYYDMEFDALLDLDATNPIRKVEDIENIVGLFKIKKPDCVFSVVKAWRNPYFNMVEINRNGFARVCKPLHKYINRRQDAPSVYEMNASMYIYKKDFLLDQRNKTPYVKRALIYEMDELSKFDIDSALDFKLIETLVKQKIVRL